MLRGWLAAGIATRVHVVEPGTPDLPDDPRVTRSADAAGVPGDLGPNVIVLAVKPQVMDEAVPPYRPFAASGALILSVAAGKTIRYLEDRVGPAAIVRAMPNTPAAIGKGISVMVANSAVDERGRALASALLSGVGEIAWVEEERLIDAVTAVSGSGPAYVFLLIEAMASAGEKLGLPTDLSMRLARQTVIGSGALAAASSESAAELRRAVTSPKGTTAAALDILMAEDGLGRLMERAIAAAARRSRELA